MYQLSSGSAIDISKFGQSYQPNFRGCIERKPRRKSILTFFKKSSKVDLNESQETLAQTTKEETETPQSSQPAVTKDETNSPIIDSNPEKTMTRSVSSVPAPFALPSSTSTYFFKPHVNASVTSATKQENLTIPAELKNSINLETTTDVYISDSSPKAIKISKWKQQYGKWEMVTAAESIFVKIAVNQEAQKSWFLVFKEEYDESIEDVIDKPVLILDINTSTDIRSSSGSDIQIQTKNSISKETMQVMIRCSKGALISEIASNLQSSINSITTPTRNHYSLSSSQQPSNNTLSSSLMDNPSKSSTFTSLSSLSNSIGDDLSYACMMNNPNAIHARQIEMTIRLQKQLQSYSQRNSPSSWEIVSMMDLCVDKIVDHQQVVYHLLLTSASDVISWVIPNDKKREIIEKIGKAGLLIKLSETEIYMLECRGKKEFKQLYEIF